MDQYSAGLNQGAEPQMPTRAKQIKLKHTRGQVGLGGLQSLPCLKEAATIQLQPKANMGKCRPGSKRIQSSMYFLKYPSF